MLPYVGMTRKQNGGYNASISVQTPIFHLVVNSTRLKTVRSARWYCPNSTMAPRLLENVVKVTNLEVVKIEFRHLPFLLITRCAYAQGRVKRLSPSIYIYVCMCVCVCVGKKHGCLLSYRSKIATK